MTTLSIGWKKLRLNKELSASPKDSKGRTQTPAQPHLPLGCPCAPTENPGRSCPPPSVTSHATGNDWLPLPTLDLAIWLNIQSKSEK